MDNYKTPLIMKLYIIVIVIVIVIIIVIVIVIVFFNGVYLFLVSYFNSSFVFFLL